MISLFRLTSSKEGAEKNNNNAQLVLKPHMQTEMDMQLDDRSGLSTVDEPTLPKNLDELAVAARALLMDKNLEVSKVRPFFWSMVEAYVDRFQIYPFDIVKAMLSYLETRDFPEEQTRELVKMLEQGYQQQHGEPLHDNLLEVSVPISEGEPRTHLVNDVQPGPESQLRFKQHAIETIDDELRELRGCLKYAAMVGEMEDK